MHKKTKIIINIVFVFCFILIVSIMGSAFVVRADEYKYDENGQITEVIHEDGSKTVYSYDENGNLLRSESVQPEEIERVEEATETESKDASGKSDTSKEPGKENPSKENPGKKNPDKENPKQPTTEDQADKNHDKNTIRHQSENTTELSPKSEKASKTNDKWNPVLLWVLVSASLTAFIIILMIRFNRNKRN